MSAHRDRIWHGRQSDFGEIWSPLADGEGLKPRIRAWKSLGHVPGSGRPRSARTLTNVTAVSQAIKDNPRQSSGNCQKLSIRSMTYQDLNMKSSSVQSRPRFTEEVRLRRLEGSQLLLNFIKSLRTANLGDVASPVARSQYAGLKHLERIIGRGSGIIPSKFWVSQGAHRGELRGDGRFLHHQDLQVFRPHVEAVIAANGGYAEWERCSSMLLTAANHRLFFALNYYGLASFVSGSAEKGQNFLRTLYTSHGWGTTAHAHPFSIPRKWLDALGWPLVCGY